MKKVLFILFTILRAATVSAQELTKAFNDTATIITQERIGSILDNGKRLISPSAFNKMMRSDFSKIQTGTRVENIASSYAALSVDRGKQTFSLSRHVHISPLGRHRFAVTASGELNGKGIFNFEDRNKIKLGVSYTHLRVFGKYRAPEDRMVYEALYDVVIHEIKEELNRNSLDGMPVDSNKSKTKKKALDKLKAELDDREIAYFDKKWAAKSFLWLTVHINPLNRDNFRYIVDADLVSFDNPYNKSINVPEATLSLNWYKESLNWIFNPSLNFVTSYKHNLSEVHSTKEWKKISQLTESSYLAPESASVYVLPDQDFHQLLLLDGELRVLAIWKKINVGLELGFANTRFITPETSNGISTINDISLGIVLPLKGADGKRTTNIVPFWSYRQYINHDKASQDMLGIRFNIPFGL